MPGGEYRPVWTVGHSQPDAPVSKIEGKQFQLTPPGKTWAYLDHHRRSVEAAPDQAHHAV